MTGPFGGAEDIQHALVIPHIAQRLGLLEPYVCRVRLDRLEPLSLLLCLVYTAAYAEVAGEIGQSVNVVGGEGEHALRGGDGLIQSALGQVSQADVVEGRREIGIAAQQLLRNLARLRIFALLQQRLHFFVQRSQFEAIFAGQSQVGQEIIHSCFYLGYHFAGLASSLVVGPAVEETIEGAQGQHRAHIGQVGSGQHQRDVGVARCQPQQLLASDLIASGVAEFMVDVDQSGEHLNPVGIASVEFFEYLAGLVPTLAAHGRIGLVQPGYKPLGHRPAGGQLDGFTPATAFLFRHCSSIPSGSG